MPAKSPSLPTQPQLKASLLYQARVLSDRYFDVFLADWTSLFFLIFQPLAVAWCAGIIWEGGSTTSTLYFIMIFSAVFFGCVNACREIVKESAIYQRERLVGLGILPYLLSKIWVLAVLGLGQTLLFYLGVRYFLALEGAAILMVLVMYLALLAGTALGLFISAAVKSDVVALALVPVCLIPQLLFSKMVMPEKALNDLVSALEHLMIIKWSYQAMEELVKTEPAWGPLGEGIGVLLLLTLGLLVGAALLLRFKEL